MTWCGCGPRQLLEKKVIHSIATVLRLLERDPDFVFVQSMPALYRMLEVDAPDLMADVSAHIASGRWEVVGGFEVEPDTNLPGGEALVRSLNIGQEKIVQLTGKPSEIAWIPDVFGYNQCLPQILALGGDQVLLHHENDLVEHHEVSLHELRVAGRRWQ